ncbi:MAG TPA: hypothetical protein V6D19_20060 [Stenomitos sp.]
MSIRRKAFQRLNLRAKLQAKEGGFTFADVMVGAALTTTVVAAGGYGLANMVNVSTTANAKSERRMEMNRALDFIGTEIRFADEIAVNAPAEADPTGFTPPSSLVKTGTIKKVLMLTVAGSDTPIVYYTAEPRDGKWYGPKVVYRWGPKFAQEDGLGYEKGDYYSRNSRTYVNVANPADWTHEALVDRISDSNGAGVNIGNGSIPATNNKGWSCNGDPGFYACVDPQGKTAQIYQTGVIKNLFGSTQNYGITSSAGTRGTAANLTSKSLQSGAAAPRYPSASGSPSPSPSPSTSVVPVPFSKTSTGVQTVNQSTMMVKMLGGDITCGAGGPVIPTSATVKLTGGTSLSQSVPATGTFNYTVAANTTLNITGLAQGNNGSGSCKKYSFSANSATNQGTQVLALVDGDTVPLFAPFGGQRTIETFLKPYINSSGKVTLNKNEVLYLFELGTTDPRSTAYDMQDLVVLATVTPTTTTADAYKKCNNGLGNGSDGCTPGNARPNDEVVYDSKGNIICTPAPGNPCTQASKQTL